MKIMIKFIKFTILGIILFLAVDFFIYCSKSDKEVEVYNTTVRLENNIIDTFLYLEGVQETYNLNKSYGNPSNHEMISKQLEKYFTESERLEKTITSKTNDYNLKISKLNNKSTFLSTANQALKLECDVMMNAAISGDWDTFEYQVNYINTELNPIFAREKTEHAYLNDSNDSKQESNETSTLGNKETQTNIDDSSTIKNNNEDNSTEDNYSKAVQLLESGDQIAALDYLNKVPETDENYYISQDLIKEIHIDNVMSRAVTYDYANLNKNLAQLKDVAVELSGQIIDIQEYDGKTLLTMNMTQVSDNVYNDSVVVMLDDRTDFIVNDYVTLYGEVVGSYGSNKKLISKWWGDSYSIYLDANNSNDRIPLVKAVIIL